MTRAEQLADAFEAVAKVNHYMVGIVGEFTYDELAGAEQILIARQNSHFRQCSAYKRLDLALDLIENERRVRR